jgi:hypothetical protein
MTNKYADENSSIYIQASYEKPPLPEPKEVVEQYLKYLADNKKWKEIYDMFGEQEIKDSFRPNVFIAKYEEPSSLKDHCKMYRPSTIYVDEVDRVNGVISVASKKPSNKEKEEFDQFYKACEKIMKMKAFL